MSLTRSLRQFVNCPVLGPSDEGFDSSREIWNRSFDRRPAVVVRPASTSDVVGVVRFAREQQLELAVKCGGHHVAGHASTEGGLLLDVSGMQAVQMDPRARSIKTQSGLTWAHFDQVTQAFGLASTGPIVSMTGLTGFTLGGGFGWLHRKAGLGCDNLRAAEVVTASGDVVVASEKENSYLLWGLQGSGWNFGVVTSMDFALHPIGPMVVAGLIYFPLDELPELVARHSQLRADFPDELTAWFFLRLAPPVPVIPKEWVGRPVAAIAMCYCGKAADGLRWAAVLATFGKPIVNTVAPVEYRAWQKSLDGRWGNGFHNDWRGHHLEDIHPAAVRILQESVRQISSPWTDIKIAHMEGAVSRVADSATAYGNRSATFALVIQARWEDAAESEAQIRWARELRDRLAPYATGGAYVNFIAVDEANRVSEAHGAENYRRLQILKAKYDAGNLFHANANVPPLK